MTTRRLRTSALALLVLCCFLWGASAPEARPIRTLDLDRDVPEADVIALVRITSSVFTRHGWFAPQWKGRRNPTPPDTGYAVDFHDVTATVLLPVKDVRKRERVRKGETLTFRHRLESEQGLPAMNGFLSHALKPGEVYLLVLRAESDGVLAVPAPEEWFYATYPKGMIADLPARAAGEQDLPYVLRLLLARFERGETPDRVGVLSAAYLMRSKAGMAYAKADPQRQRIVRRIERLVDTDLGSDAHSRVLWMLHELGKPVATGKILGWILDRKLAQHVRMNLVGMFSRLPAASQVAALERVVSGVSDKELRATAVRALTHAHERLAREQEQERLRREARKHERK